MKNKLLYKLKWIIFIGAVLAIFIIIRLNAPDVLHNYYRSKLVKDPVLEKMIRIALDKPYGFITIEDLHKIEFLDNGGRGEHEPLSSLEGLQYCVNIEKIDFNWIETPADADNISDLHPLKNLTKLKVIELPNAQIKDIKPLANLVNLNSLVLGYNLITDISLLENLKNLDGLDLRFNKINNIITLTKMPKLKDISLQHNKIRNILPLLSDEYLIKTKATINLKDNPLYISPNSKIDRAIKTLRKHGVYIVVN